MNSKHLRYHWGRLVNGCGDIIYSAAAPFFVYWAVQGWNIGNTKGLIANSIFAGLIGLKGYTGLRSRFALWRDKKHLDENPGEYCFAESNRIVIKDKEGLEALLEETGKKRWREWGSVLNAHEEDGDAVIDKILSREETAKTGVFKYNGWGLQVMDVNRILNFKGMIHYHPRLGSGNYCINTLDRRMPVGLINLLAFNTSQGPEIIGYNIRYTYIPADKTDKSVLVKATPEDIMKYLSD